MLIINNAVDLEKKIIENGFTVTGLSIFLNLSKSTISQCLRRKTISPGVAKKIADELHIDHAIFFTNTVFKKDTIKKVKE